MIRKIKRWTLISLGIIFLFAAGVITYVYLNQSHIVQQQLLDLNKELQGHVSIGETELAPFENFPYVSIKVYDIKITEDKQVDSNIILDVNDIYLGFNLWDVLGGYYHVQSLIVEDGVFNIVIHEDNSLNLLNALKTAGNNSTSAANLKLKKIELINVDVHTLDEATQTDVEKFIYQAVGGFEMINESITGHIDADFELNVIKEKDTTFFNHKHFEVHTDVLFDQNTGLFTMEPSGIKMENGDFELSGTIDTKDDMNLDLSFKGAKPNFDMLLAFAPAQAVPLLDRYKNAGDIYFNAAVKGKANKGNKPSIEVNFGASSAFLENTIKNKKIDDLGFKGHFTNGALRDLETMEFSLQNMHASLNDGEFKADVLITNFESPEVEMKVDAVFNLNFITEFLNLDGAQDMSGQVALKMNFHDVIDLGQPQNTLAQINQAYFTQLQLTDVAIDLPQLNVPISNLNASVTMNGKIAQIDQLELSAGNTDLSITGSVSDMPAILHHSDIPVITQLQVKSKRIDLAELTARTIKDSTTVGIDEQLTDLALGMSFLASARDFTESEFLPRGEFLIHQLEVDLQNYPHRLHDFNADVLIDDRDVRLKDFSGFIDDSDFHVDGFFHDYKFWLQPELNGNVTVDFSLTSQRLRLKDLFAYNGENYVPKEYRHEVFDNLQLHATAGMHYKDSSLSSIDVTLDKLSTRMQLHPLPFRNFKGNFGYKNDHITITDFSGSVGQTNFSIDFDYYLGKDEKLKEKDNYLSLDANYINYDELFHQNDEVAASVKNSDESLEDVDIHAASFNIYELPFTTMKFNANIDHFIHHKLDFKDISTTLRTTPDHYIYVDNFEMNAADGLVKLNGYFNGSDPQHIYLTPNLGLENIDVDQLLFKFENFGQDHLVSENLQGRLTAFITGKIRVYPDLVPDLDQSTLKMDVQVLNGKLKDYDPILAFADYLGDKNLKSIRFDTLQNQLKINNGQMEIPKMTIESTLGHMELSGTHDVDHNIDYYLRIPIKTVKKAAWQKLFGRKSDSLKTTEDAIVKVDTTRDITYLNLKVQGNLDDYRISLGKKRE